MDGGPLTPFIPSVKFSVTEYPVDPDESFNLLDELALDAAAPTTDGGTEDAALEQALKEHYDTFYQAITVVRAEDGTVSVQGKDIPCEKYTEELEALAQKMADNLIDIQKRFYAHFSVLAEGY